MIMGIVFLVIINSFLLTTLFGHVAHWAIHHRWMGKLYEAHTVHHVDMYPPRDFESDAYRSSGKNSSFFVFFLLGLPLLALPFVLVLFHAITVPLAFLSMGVMGLVGLFNDVIHDSFHMRVTRWSKIIPWYSLMKQAHVVHHKHVKKNFGIFTFLWDKLLGTYMPAHETHSEPS